MTPGTGSSTHPSSAPCLHLLCNSWDPTGMSPKQLQELGVASVQELQAVREQRLAARRALTALLTSPDVSGPDKQRARCAFTHEHLRLPYQCRTCWLLPGNCVCGKLRKASPRTKVVIHLHVDEWGRGEPAASLQEQLPPSSRQASASSRCSQACECSLSAELCWCLCWYSVC
jgi:hypothetical protein